MFPNLTGNSASKPGLPFNPIHGIGWRSLIKKRITIAAIISASTPKGAWDCNSRYGARGKLRFHKVRVPLMQWRHVAGTFDPLTGVSLYIDGKLAGTFPVKGRTDPGKENRASDR